MNRSLGPSALVLVLAVALAGAPGATPAAPVPKHLMPKVPPFAHPTVVGTKWVYDRNGQDEVSVITAAEDQKGGKLVTIESELAGGQRQPCHKLLVAAREWSMVEETGAAYSAPWCRVKAPTGEVQKWAFDLSRTDLNERLKGTKVQAAKLERIKLPFGEFDALRIDTSDPGRPPHSVHRFVSGIGLVQIGDPPCLTLKAFTPGKE